MQCRTPRKRGAADAESSSRGPRSLGGRAPGGRGCVFGFYTGRTQQSSNHENAWIMFLVLSPLKLYLQKFEDRIGGENCQA